jgi:hypothetical protein
MNIVLQSHVFLSLRECCGGFTLSDVGKPPLWESYRREEQRIGRDAAYALFHLGIDIAGGADTRSEKQAHRSMKERQGIPSAKMPRDKSETIF